MSPETPNVNTDTINQPSQASPAVNSDMVVKSDNKIFFIIGFGVLFAVIAGFVLFAIKKTSPEKAVENEEITVTAPIDQTSKTVSLIPSQKLPSASDEQLENDLQNLEKAIQSADISLEEIDQGFKDQPIDLSE